jgi:drug/metabolite transporter (DMT)-like permease
MSVAGDQLQEPRQLHRTRTGRTDMRRWRIWVAAPSPHLRGVVLATAGALCLVPDTTFIRLANAGNLQVAFWRSLFIGLALTSLVAARHRTRTLLAYRAIGALGLTVGLLWGTGLLLFVYAVNHTAVANVLVILATMPLFAALFTRLFIGETIHRRTWLAMLAVAGGVALTFASALRLGGLDGNLAALAVAAVMGGNLTLIRRAGGIDMVPAISLAGFVAAGLVLASAWPVGISTHDYVVIGANGLVFMPAAFVLGAVSTRFLPSPQVSLLLMLETVLGPLLAWVVVHEQPPPLAAVGGVLVVATLTIHFGAALREEKRVAEMPA